MLVAGLVLIGLIVMLAMGGLWRAWRVADRTLTDMEQAYGMRDPR